MITNNEQVVCFVVSLPLTIVKFKFQRASDQRNACYDAEVTVHELLSVRVGRLGEAEATGTAVAMAHSSRTGSRRHIDADSEEPPGKACQLRRSNQW